VDHPKIFDLPQLRNRIRVFRDRAAAGKVLAGMLEEFQSSHGMVMGIPAEALLSLLRSQEGYTSLWTLPL